MLRTKRHRISRAATVAAAFLLGVVATASSSAAAETAASRSSTISSNWTAFFSGTTSAQRKIALLQDGSKFASIIKAQAASSLSKSSKAKVLQVSNVTKSSATVRYTIYLGATPALVNQKGSAVQAGGTWRVSDASFCALLSLEGTKTPNCRS